jgi:hypothetical protein
MTPPNNAMNRERCPMKSRFILGVLALVLSMNVRPVTVLGQGIEIPSCTMSYGMDAFPLESLRATKYYVSFCAQKLQKAKQCFEKAERVTADLQRISESFAKRLEQGGVGTGNIWNRYLSLKQSTLQNQERIGLLIRDFKDVPTDEARILQQMSNLHTRFAADIESLNSVYNAESQLLGALDELQAELESAGLSDGMKLQANDGSACDQKEFSPTATKLEQLPRQMYSDSVIIKDSITKTRQAREALVQYAFFYFKLALENAYKNAINGGLSDLGGKLDAVLQAKTVGAEFEAWVTYTATENDRNYLESVYLQFTKPFALAVLDQKTAQNFLDRMRVIRDAYPEVAAPYVTRIESMIKFFGDKVARIEKKGWNGYLSSQKSWADRYVANPAQVSKECVAAMSEYLKSYSAVESFDVFQQAEDAYKAAATICRRK